MQEIQICELTETVAIYDAIAQLGGYLDPPLTGRAGFDLGEYAQKLADTGRVFAAVNEQGQLLGALAMYANDLGGSNAWGTFLAVMPESRHQQVGTKLFEQAVAAARAAGKTGLHFRVHRNNKAAIRFYQNRGSRLCEPGQEQCQAQGQGQYQAQEGQEQDQGKEQQDDNMLEMMYMIMPGR